MSETTVFLAAQSIMPRLNIDEYYNDINYKNKIVNLINLGVCGFCIFNGLTENARRLIEELQSIAENPLIFTADFEFGLPMRLSEGNEFPHLWAIAETDDTNNAFEIGKAIAKESKDIGVDWVFAPVVDISDNPENPVINIRSFGDNPEKVQIFSKEFIAGMQSEKVIATAKHFPGHGSTSFDSHFELPYLTKSKKELEDFEIIPFKASIDIGVKSIMTAHLMVGAFDNNLPTSLSKNCIEYLRNSLNYKGIIITDALEMAAIDNYELPAYKAIKAGANIALMPKSPENEIDYISKIADEEPIFLKCLEENFKLIQNIKRWVGLIPKFAKDKPQEQVFIGHQKEALRIAFKALKFNGNLSLLPINEKITYSSFSFIEKDKDIRSASRFFTMLAQATDNDCDYAYINLDISQEELDEFILNLGEQDLMIFNVFNKIYSDAKLVKMQEIIESLSQGCSKIVQVFGNPEYFNKIKCDFKLCTFSDSFPSLASSVIKLTGREENFLNYY